MWLKNEPNRRLGRPRRAATVVSAMFLGSGLAAFAHAQVRIGPYSGTFGDVREVTELNDCNLIQWSPSVTEDGLIVVLARGPSEEAPFDLYMATRESPSDQFDSPEPIDELNTDFGEGNPNISADGLTIAYNSGRAGTSDVYVATRASRTEPFGEPMPPDASINTEAFDEFDPHLSYDGLALYFTRGEPPVGDEILSKNTRLFVAVRPSLDVPWDSVDVEAMPLHGADSSSGDAHSSLSADGAVIFWSEWSPVVPHGDDIDIWFATRVGNEPAEFSGAERLPFPVNTGEYELTPWIGYDWPARGSKLWFIRGNGSCSQWLVYEATWTPSDPSFRRGDCNADGQVNVADASCALDWLFSGDSTPGCLAAVNANADNRVDIADPVALLNFLFSGGPIISDPFPDCGPLGLPEDVELGCLDPPECQ